MRKIYETLKAEELIRQYKLDQEDPAEEREGAARALIAAVAQSFESTGAGTVSPPDAKYSRTISNLFGTSFSVRLEVTLMNLRLTLDDIETNPAIVYDKNERLFVVDQGRTNLALRMAQVTDAPSCVIYTIKTLMDLAREKRLALRRQNGFKPE